MKGTRCTSAINQTVPSASTVAISWITRSLLADRQAQTRRTGIIRKNDPAMRSMYASAQSLQSERRIFMRMIEGLHFVFTAILPGAAQGAWRGYTTTAATFDPVQL
jgi:hypothetical protein